LHSGENEMTKKTTNKTEKKATEDKIISAATLKKINSKLMSTKKDLEDQVEDLSAQVKKLSKKPEKKALKLLKKLEQGYQKKLVDLQTEFEERLASVSKVQDKVLERLPKVVAEKIISTENEIAKSIKSVKFLNTKPVSKSEPKAVTKTSTIASIKGIGPVMQKKLAEKGISTLEDLANTPSNKIDTLKEFEKERGFNTWKEQAVILLADK
jgi:predicted flap endonuclease-1-like 5' DNA nuclease